MEPQNRHLMLKIVIGSAWIDHHLEPGEVKYLQTLLERYQLAHNPELLALLEKPVFLPQTEQWMVQYLMGATEIERLQLLGAIGKMVIADEIVSPEDHNLLDDYYNLMADIPPKPEVTPTLLKTVGQFVRRVLQGRRQI
ncbi:MAG: TerB family tellurite resistance protein [Chroococcidiopsidaceae cyanobacterium CP_BM_RX_35]|nr:TerB family tellurite resistance protein [Chroococcidiopsidaceae cyanobacterium CP_BM_RX_35]